MASRISDRPADDDRHNRHRQALYAAYVAKDRPAAELLLADDFSFTSPLDNAIDRATYFAICWPSSGGMKSFNFVQIAQSGERVFVTYEGEGEKTRFRNTEIITVRDGKIAAVEVYFGWNVPHDVRPGEHTEPH